ncbi:hypothetical protein IIQ43_08270 [Acinetobacter oleivorans]|uniref:ATP-binding protein n=1 Tax=Acinetobacter oleivorans TaxID=1148157 RepID=A0ABR9NIS2_9GAMM|nr:hypothetical protein [Acinetobacter oleivorans]MBE2164534.1 hypothetical protein [Acinetobacter oleivorans]
MDDLQNLIFNVLSKHPNLKGREIAKKLGLEKQVVNSFLAKNKNKFYMDENYQWNNNINKTEFVVEFQKGWVDAEIFERNLVEYNNLFELNGKIRFVFSETRLLLDAIMRLLCLSNQLGQQGRLICLDFRSCINTFGYLDRLGFFKHLHDSVQVLPEKPKASLAEKYSKNSENLIEVFPICPKDIDNGDVLRISDVFKKSFCEHEIQILLPKLQMFVASLIDNVRQHGQSELVGYSALQIYNLIGQNQKKIVLVIADNGAGLISTLRHALTYDRYRDLALLFGENSIENNKSLLAHALNNGGITQKEDENRGGLGLNEAHLAIAKISKQETVDQLEIKNIDVNVSIRLDDCLYNFPYKYNQLKTCDLVHKAQFTKIYGTQFILTILLTK